MTDHIKWTNPLTEQTHVVGQRVLWVDGRANYAETGYPGTVLTVPGDGGDTFTVRLDPVRAKKKRKSDPDPEPQIVEFSTDKVLPVQESLKRTINRLRAVADDYERITAQYDADSIPLDPQKDSSTND